jgi:hypothetical protein
LKNLKKASDYAWLGLGDVNLIQLDNPLMNRTEEELETPGLREISLMRQVEYIHFAAKFFLDLELLPAQIAVIRELWVRPFPMIVASRGWGKSFLLAVYFLLKMILCKDVKIVICGAGIRQSKVVFDYMENLWFKSPVLHSICDPKSGPKHAMDRLVLTINGNTATALPLGNGDKIRGMRATITCAEEFSSIDPQIYGTVIEGFSVVSSSPIQNVQLAAKRKYEQEQNTWSDKQEESFQSKKGNQSIISGTAHYDFNHFAHYWRRYKAIIESRGDEKKLRQLFPEGELPNWKNYSIIRIPYELTQEGFMDKDTIIRAKSLVHSGIAAMEYGAVFTKDSDGFFKRTLIESCVCSDKNTINLGEGQIIFDAKVKGRFECEHIIGVDPASEIDNFCIIVLEVHPNHSRIVYCWTVNKRLFKEKSKLGLTKEHDFYGFCARKIRELMKVFPIVKDKPAIAIDAQGGGYALLEALQDKDKLRGGEIPIYEAVEDTKEKPSDDLPGLHIVQMCQFANSQWTASANHGMKKDFEDKALLFPRYDAVSLGLADFEDSIQKEKDDPLNLYDSLEECILEIEELKNEIVTIIHTNTGTGVNSRERWDTPEVKVEGSKKGRLRKDRYSALLLANSLARSIRYGLAPVKYNMVGGLASDLKNRKDDKTAFYSTGPDWFLKQANVASNHFGVIKRGKE